MKMLSMINLADMRILDISAELGTYRSLELVLKKINDIYMAKPIPNHTISILCSQLLK